MKYIAHNGYYIKGFLMLKNISRVFLSLMIITYIICRITCVNAEDMVRNNYTKNHYIDSFADIVEPLMPSVVNIYTIKVYHGSNLQRRIPENFPFNKFGKFLDQFNSPFSLDELYTNHKSMALGSGFIINEHGLIVTNYHLIANSDEIHVKLSDNTEFPAKIIGIDAKTDLALLKIDAANKLPYVKFANSDKARVGDIVIAIGNPLGFGGTVTTGIISSKARDLGVSMDDLVDDFIQTDAAINTGNSGGPLFDISGKVIGVNTAIPAVGGGTNIGIGFAIPANTVQDIIKQLEVNGKITRGRLDIVIQDVTPDLVDALNLSADYGTLVVDVRQGGTGDKAGLKHGDLITEFNKAKVENSRKLQLFVADTKINSEVDLTVLRNNEPIILKANIVESTYNNTPIQIETLEKSGVLFSNVSPMLIQKFALDENSKGIAVVGFNNKNGDIDLRIGDLVTSINQENIENITQFYRMYNNLKNQGKDKAVLLVKRQDIAMYITIPLE